MDREEWKKWKDWGSIDFCPDLPGGTCNCDKIAALLGEHLFANDQTAKDLFSARYKQMRENFLDKECDDGAWDLPMGTEKFICKGKDALLSIPRRFLPNGDSPFAKLWDHANFGHDMPTWMVKKGVENPPRVMIVSIDPLRTDRPAGDLLLSTPFGFHSKSYRDDGHNSTSIAYNLVWRLLNEKDACVYLTDCRKFYTSDVKDGNEKGYNFVASNLRKFRKTFKAILDDEIVKFNPDVILTLGVPTAKFCGIESPADGCNVQNAPDNRKYIAAYHPTDRSGQFKKKKLAEKRSEYFDLVFKVVDAQIKAARS